MRKKSLSILIIFLLVTFTAINSFAEKDNQFWTGAIVSGSMIKKDSNFKYYAELQPRFVNDMNTYNTLIARGALGYQIYPKLVLWAGYGFMPTYADANYHSKLNHEERIWQMITYDHEILNLGLKIGHRLIIEQRNVENATGTGNRVRYRLKALKPLKTFCNNYVLGLVAFDELMYNTTSLHGQVESGYERNRLFIGPYITKDFWRVEAGYLLESTERVNKSDRLNNIFAAYLLLNF